MTKRSILTIFVFVFSLLVVVSGCSNDFFSGYNHGSLYPESVKTVYVEMFDSQSFRRGHEFQLTQAICKQLEVQTPYKIISDRNQADTLLSGKITKIGTSVLTTERESGLALEKEAKVYVLFTWKNLETGEMLVENKEVAGVSSYSPFQNQEFDYAADVAVNNAAVKVVEALQLSW